MKFQNIRARILALSKTMGLSDLDLQSVIHGAAFTLSVQLAASVVNYTSQIVLARWMGMREFGIFSFAWTITGPFAVAAALGLAAAAARFIPQYLTQERIGQLHGYYRRSLTLGMVCGVFIVSVGWLFLNFPGDLLPSQYISPTRIAILSIPFMTIIVLLSGISRGFGWAGLASVPQTLLIPLGMLTSLGIYILFFGKPSSSDALVVVVSVTVIVAVLHYLLFRRKLAEEVLNSVPVYETHTWLRVAVPLFLADGLVVILWSVDIAMLASLKTSEDVAIYSACMKTAGLTYIVFIAIRGFAAPKFSALIQEDDPDRQQQFVRSIARWTAGPTFLAGIVVIVAGKFILGTFGAAFVAGYPVLLVLVFGNLLRSTTGPLSAYLAVSGNQDIVLLAGFAAALLNIVLNASLIPSYGVLGAAGATIISATILQVVFYTMVYRRLGLHSIIFPFGPARISEPDESA